MSGDLPFSFFQELYSDLQHEATKQKDQVRGSHSPIDMEIVSSVETAKRTGANDLVPRDLAAVDPPIADTSNSPPPQLVLSRTFSYASLPPTPPPLEAADPETPRHCFVDLTEVSKCWAPVAPCRQTIRVPSPSSDSDQTVEDPVDFLRAIYM
jgi:hypothetical protein